MLCAADDRACVGAAVLIRTFLCERSILAGAYLIATNLGATVGGKNGLSVGSQSVQNSPKAAIRAACRHTAARLCVLAAKYSMLARLATLRIKLQVDLSCFEY